MIEKITISSLEITDANDYVLGDSSGFEFAELRIDIKNRGNSNGANLGLYNLGKRSYSIDGEIWGDDADDYEEKRRTLENALQFDPDNGLKTIYIQTRAGLLLQTQGILTSIDVPYKKGDVTHGTFQIQWQSPYPFLESQTLESEDLDVAEGGGFAIPFAIPFSIGNGATGATVIANDGNGDAYPTIRIYGGIENPSIRNATQDKTLSITYTLDSGTDYIDIDMYNKTAFLNGTTNIRQYVSGDWFTLSPGNNTISFFGIAPNASTQATVSFRHSYIGI